MITVTRDIGLASMVGNPIMLWVNTNNHTTGGSPRPFYTLFLELFLEDPSLGGDPYDTLSIQPDDDGNGYFDLAPLLSPLVKPTLPWQMPGNFEPQKDANAVVSFWVRLRDGYGIPFVVRSVEYTSEEYVAIPGGFDDAVLQGIENAESDGYSFISDHGLLLTSQPRCKRTALGAVEYLRYFNPSKTAENVKLMLREHKLDGSNSDTELWDGSLDALSLYSFNVSPELLNLNAQTVKWDIWLELESEDNYDEIHYAALNTGDSEPIWWDLSHRNMSAITWPLIYNEIRTYTQPGMHGEFKLLVPNSGPTKNFRVTFKAKAEGLEQFYVYVGSSGNYFALNGTYKTIQTVITGLQLSTYGILANVPEKNYIYFDDLKIEEEVTTYAATEVVSFNHTDQPLPSIRNIIFQNSLGGYDTILANGMLTRIVVGSGVVGQIAKTGSLRKWEEPLQERKRGLKKLQGTLGYYTNDELNWLIDFFLSEERYLIDDDGSTLLKLVSLNSEVPEHVEEPPAEFAIEAELGTVFTRYFKR
ncbi:MAG: hypothetical protein PHS05_10470 [Bacteroidales bacterium]|nr:hypothetical protein [Bacteroidales bacterium]